METEKYLNRFMTEAVSTHVNQTGLAEALLASSFFREEAFSSWADPETGEPYEVFEWHSFPYLHRRDYDALEASGKFPMIRSQFSTWVGFTSTGSSYDLYVHPDLLLAIYGVKATSEEIRWLREA